MKQHKAINFNEVMKPSIDSGRFIANDGMMFFANPKPIFAIYNKTLGISIGGIDIIELASDCCIRLHKYDGEKISSGKDFLSIIFRAISAAIGRVRYWNMKSGIIRVDSDYLYSTGGGDISAGTNTASIGVSEENQVTARMHDTSYNSEIADNKIDTAYVDKIIAQIYGNDYLQILNKQIYGYNKREAASHRNEGHPRSIYRTLERRRNAANTQKALRVLQSNFR